MANGIDLSNISSEDSSKEFLFNELKGKCLNDTSKNCNLELLSEKIAKILTMQMDDTEFEDITNWFFKLISGSSTREETWRVGVSIFLQVV